MLLVVFTPLAAQQLRFKHITNEDGLSTNFVSSILQDDKGFIWMGTQDGLNKYNAYQIQVFKKDPSNTNSLANSEINALHQLRSDLILVGTREGLSFFNPINETFETAQHSSKLGKINTFFVSNDSLVLVGAEFGLYELNTKRKKVSKAYFAQSEKTEVRCIAQYNGKLYFGTSDKGLWQLSANNQPLAISLADKDNAAPEALKNITHIEIDQDYIYLSTFGAGIYALNKQLLIQSHISFAARNTSSDFINDFKIRERKLYCATAHGLVVYDMASGQSYDFVKQENSAALNDNLCNSIYFDTQNNCWIGTELGGVNVAFAQSLKFPLSNLKYETDFTNVFSFCDYKQDHILLAGVKLFSDLDLKTGKVEDYSAFLENGTALAIARESASVFWIATWGNGIYRYDLATNKTKNFLSTNIGGTIVSLNIVGNNLYAGSIGDGLFKINLQTEAITRFTEKDGLPSGSISSLFKDSKGNVWLGTLEGGLVKMKGFDVNDKLNIDKIYKNTNQAGQIASNAILAINEDKNGAIWVATSTGLSKLKSDGSFHNFYEKDGLSNSYLYALLQDKAGNFWMSSNSGIMRFDPLLPEKDIVFKTYGLKDGLVNNEYSMGAAFQSASGSMFVGGTKGFNMFKPEGIKENVSAARAYVIGYKRGGKDVKTDSLIAYKKHLNLTWRENYFQFELAALDYTDPSKNKFSYMLEGYDDEWSAPSNVRYVSYTELPGGDYTFKVKAANNDGVWNEQAFEIKITVVPPFWKTKTFYVFVILLGVAGVVSFTQYRTRAIKKENKILENKVAERTKELAEKNHDIMSSIQYAQRIQEAILPSKDFIFKKIDKIFILYKPKDIVSGDFYWFAEKNGVKIFAVVDCTGHGVPGAFMSMIGHNLLNQIVLEKGIVDPAEILNNLHKGIQEALRQGKNEIKTNDGMDVSLITLNDAEKWIKWAGANRPLVVVDANGELTKYDGNKFPVGGAQLETERVFTTQSIVTSSPSMAYMSSDGYADQFGGEKGKKFMVKRYHELLLEIHLQNADEQRNALEASFQEWKQGHEQVDDVLVVGIAI